MIGGGMQQHRSTAVRLLWATLVVAGCSPETGAATAPSASASVAPSAVSASAARLVALHEAELTRAVERVENADLHHPQAAVRRAAVRVLARSRDPRTHKALAQALVDEDPDTVAWAAYGLGDICPGRRDSVVHALVAAAAAARVRLSHVKAGETALDVGRAITHALGKCGNASAEASLVAIAQERGPWAPFAALALGRLKRPREETYVAMLNLAEGDATHAPLPEALYPLSRVAHLTPSVLERTLRVATKALEDKGPSRIFAIAALGRVDDEAIPLLAAVARDPKYDEAERVEAIKALPRFAGRGQRALRALIGDLIDALGSPAKLDGPEVALLLVGIDRLTELRGIERKLQGLAALPLADGATVAQRRRLSWLRCTAAVVALERKYSHPLLRACDLDVAEADRNTDPIASTIGARAVVRAIGVDGVRIVGPRLRAWRAYALEGERRSRQAAIEQLREHDEILESAETLTKALKEEEPGLVATAAQVIAARPRRALQRDRQKKKGKDPEAGAYHAALVETLLARLEPSGPTEDQEALAAVIDAVGALKLEDAKNKLLSRCRSPWVTIRGKAEQALGAVMGRAAPKCNEGDPMPLPIEIGTLVTKPTRLSFATDHGEMTLTLEPALAPVAVTRMLQLAKNDFFDGMIVHRVVPGFVTQFGSPTADGFGGVKGMPAMPCETSPTTFAPLTVGIALAGRDTGSSQLFVTHAAVPRLDGEYAFVGHAEGPWHAFVDGDSITEVTVE
jgi:cyclophilin family peptidyl-prolyl cis-trans isomerase